MVQSFNAKALVTLASVLRRPYLMSPHVFVNNISEVNYTALKEMCNIRAVVFDKDNTLTAPYALQVHENARKGFQSAIETFGVANVAILSNSAGTLDDDEYEDAIEIETSLQIPVIRHDEKKPGGLNECLAHFHLDDPCQICMIGDRLLTDVVFGNLHGMLTIHTLPLCVGSDNRSDNKIASLIRSVENAGLYSNWSIPGRMIRNRTPSHKYWPGQETCPLIIASNSEEEGETGEARNDDGNQSSSS